MPRNESWPIKLELETDLRGARAPGYKPGTRIRVTAGLHWLDGNAAPYWSVTAAIGTPRELQTGDWQSGGCCHDEVLRHWPQLAPVVALHLADDAGVPMHAVANAIYHAGRSRRFGGSGYYPANADHLRSHLRINAEQARQLIEEAPTARAIELFVVDQIPRWRDESAAALQLLRDMGAVEVKP